MNFEGIKDYIRVELDKVNAEIKLKLSNQIDLVNKANSLVLSRSGKQMRPVMSVLMAKACSENGRVSETSLHYAAATELLHNATLLHDDVADNSPVRRGQPTILSLLGGRASVLLGDYWLVKAMVEIFEDDGNGQGLRDKVIMLYSKTLSDLSEGELLQLQKADSGDTEEKDYYQIIYSKTASLFVTAAMSAAMSVGASQEKVEAAREYATSFGIAFQIKDDIFDYQEDASIGKPVGMDLKERKITLPLLGALQNVPSDEAEKIRQMVCKIDDRPEYQAEIVAFVRENGGMDYAKMRLQEYIDKAKSALRHLGESKDAEMLAQMADFIAERKS